MKTFVFVQKMRYEQTGFSNLVQMSLLFVFVLDKDYHPGGNNHKYFFQKIIITEKITAVIDSKTV